MNISRYIFGGAVGLILMMLSSCAFYDYDHDDHPYYHQRYHDRHYHEYYHHDHDGRYYDYDNDRR